MTCLDRKSELEALGAEARACHRCALAETRTEVVFGAGEVGAGIMLIGEAPGRNEDLSGEPFVGAAGRLLDGLLEGSGLSRGDVYIANILKCRPPGNRDPRPQEIETCTPFLTRQIALLSPRVIVTLGNFATRFILDTAEGITSLRGRVFERDAFSVVPVFHPAAVIRDPSKRVLLEADLRLAASLAAGSPSEACASRESR